MVTMDSPIPVWIYRWLALSAFICIIDGSFCVFRPHTLPEGCLATLFYPYKWYLLADKNYANVKDVFIWTQGFGNLIESATNLLIVFNFFKNIRIAKVVTIIVSAMTFWKTVLFSVYSLEIPVGHTVESWWGEFMVFGMGAFWMILPALSMWELTKHFTAGGASVSSHGMKRSNVTVTSSAASNYVAGSSSEEEADNSDDIDGPAQKMSPNTRRYNLRRR